MMLLRNEQKATGCEGFLFLFDYSGIYDDLKAPLHLSSFIKRNLKNLRRYGFSGKRKGLFWPLI